MTGGFDEEEILNDDINFITETISANALHLKNQSTKSNLIITQIKKWGRFKNSRYIGLDNVV